MYERQRLFLGKSKQSKLFRAKVVLIGCGALGSNIAIALARTGIGNLTLVDMDKVREENLGTQQYSRSDIGASKSAALKRIIGRISKKIKVRAIIARIDDKNIDKIITGRDLVLDGTDSMQARFTISDACGREGIPWIYGSCAGQIGSYALFLPGGPRFRSVFRKAPRRIETADTVGIVSSLPPIIANLQVTEAIKALTGEKTDSSLVFYDCLKKEFCKVKLKK